MDAREKYEVFCQISYLIIKCRDLISSLKSKKNKQKIDIDVDIEKIERVIDKYYMNFDLCPTCGHPIPSLPTIRDLCTFEPIVRNYISIYELKTGESVERSLIETSRPNINAKVLEEEEDFGRKKLSLSPQLSSLGEKTRPVIIKGQLLGVE